jgi:hypothetical protein
VTYLPAPRQRAANSQLTEITALFGEKHAAGRITARFRIGSDAHRSFLDRGRDLRRSQAAVCDGRPPGNANPISPRSILPALCEAARSIHARLSRRRLRWHSNAHFRPPRQSVVLSGIAKGRTHLPRASGFQPMCAISATCKVPIPRMRTRQVRSRRTRVVECAHLLYLFAFLSSRSVQCTVLVCSFALYWCHLPRQPPPSA